MKVYCCQFDIAWEDKAANLRTIIRLLQDASPVENSLVLLPEMALSGFTMNTSAVAEPPHGPNEEALAGLAQAHRIFLLAGLVVSGPAGKVFNQSVVFSPEGREVARYAKRQPFSLGGEATHYTAGERCETFHWSECLVAPFICYDLRFPEIFRIAAWQRPQLFTVIASWPERRISHWVKLLQARAIENQAYLAGVNRIGRDPSLPYTGRSVIVSPQGEILADAEAREAVISVDLDLPALAEYRRTLPFLDDMREEHIRRA